MEEKTREQLQLEMMQKIAQGQNNLHLTEVAKPGVHEPVHTEEKDQK